MLPFFITQLLYHIYYAFESMIVIITSSFGMFVITLYLLSLRVISWVNFWTQLLKSIFTRWCVTILFFLCISNLKIDEKLWLNDIVLSYLQLLKETVIGPLLHCDLCSIVTLFTLNNTNTIVRPSKWKHIDIHSILHLKHLIIKIHVLLISYCNIVCVYSYIEGCWN